MSARIDHAAQAEEWLADAKRAEVSFTASLHDRARRIAEAEAFAAIAQVYATLALAEQQRIANLVALGVIGGGPINNATPRHARDYLSREYPDESKVLGL